MTTINDFDIEVEEVIQEGYIVEVEIPPGVGIVEETATLVQGPRGPAGVAGPAGPQGPQGLPGTGGDLYYVYEQTTAAGTWSFPVPGYFPRLPNIAIYIGGELVESDIIVLDGNVTIIFPQPMSGTAVLT